MLLTSWQPVSFLSRPDILSALPDSSRQFLQPFIEGSGMGISQKALCLPARTWDEAFSHAFLSIGALAPVFLFFETENFLTVRKTDFYAKIHESPLLQDITVKESRNIPLSEAVILADCDTLPPPSLIVLPEVWFNMSEEMLEKARCDLVSPKMFLWDGNGYEEKYFELPPHMGMLFAGIRRMANNLQSGLPQGTPWQIPEELLRRITACNRMQLLFLFTWFPFAYLLVTSPEMAPKEKEFEAVDENISCMLFQRISALCLFFEPLMDCQCRMSRWIHSGCDPKAFRALWKDLQECLKSAEKQYETIFRPFLENRA